MGPVGARRSGWLISATRMASAASSCSERIGRVGLLGQSEQALLEIREIVVRRWRAALRRFRFEQRDHQAKGDGGGDREKQKNARRQQAGRREGVAVDDPDQEHRDHQRRNGDQRSALRNRQETQAVFQPLKVSVQLIESVHTRPPSPPKDIGSRILIQLWRLSRPIAKRSATGSRAAPGCRRPSRRRRACRGRGRCFATGPASPAGSASSRIRAGRRGRPPFPRGRWRGESHRSLRAFTWKDCAVVASLSDKRMLAVRIDDVDRRRRALWPSAARCRNPRRRWWNDPAGRPDSARSLRRTEQRKRAAEDRCAMLSKVEVKTSTRPSPTCFSSSSGAWLVSRAITRDWPGSTRIT